MANYKVVDTDELDAKLSAIGDSVRVKTGKTELIPIDDIPAEIDGISGSGGTDAEIAKWIEGEPFELYDPNATSVVDNFAYPGNTQSSSITLVQKTLTSIDLPNVITVGKLAFWGCAKLTSLNLPNVETIGESAFEKCTSLEVGVNLPNLKSMSLSVFEESRIKSFSAPNFSGTIVSSVFYKCTNLEWVSFPQATQANAGGSLTYRPFGNCSSLKRVSMPKAHISSAWVAFQNCTSLKVVELLRFANSSSNYNNRLPAESDNTSIRVIALHDTNRNTLKEVPTDGVFAEGGEGGYMLVASSLIDSYKTATNWSALVELGTVTFLPLEEYTVDGTLEGELDWDKVEALIPDDESGGVEE